MAKEITANNSTDLTNLITTTDESIITYLTKTNSELVSFVQQLDQQINAYKKIALFFHTRPDPDTLGSVFALKELIKLNYAHKQVVIVCLDESDDINNIDPDILSKLQNTAKNNKHYNKNNKNQTPLSTDINELFIQRLLHNLDQFETYNGLFYLPGYYLASKINYTEFFKDSQVLGISCDSGVGNRLVGYSPYFKQCAYTMAIDHHIFSENFANIMYQSDNFSANCEILVFITLLLRWNFNQNALNYLYLGLLTDTNRFLFNSTDQLAYYACLFLINHNVNRNYLHATLYQKNENSIDFNNYLWANRQKVALNTKENVVYTIIPMNKHLEFNLKSSGGRVNILMDIKNTPIWFMVFYDGVRSIYKVSMRSSTYDLVDLAKKYNGGGHKFAVSMDITDLKQVDDIIADLKILVNHKKTTKNQAK